ncbi:unnamed protein product [Pleuronectes platessa]|uniref:Uncharacterized protein n=1 Tax=Pleuronectes platessa TaxID=8262 RepID=A0A9N7TZY7_PLEPL|nr:unnamed protein product [Pleuronectes platessa]
MWDRVRDALLDQHLHGSLVPCQREWRKEESRERKKQRKAFIIVSPNLLQLYVRVQEDGKGGACGGEDCWRNGRVLNEGEEGDEQQLPSTQKPFMGRLNFVCFLLAPVSIKVSGRMQYGSGMVQIWIEGPLVASGGNVLLTLISSTHAPLHPRSAPPRRSKELIHPEWSSFCVVRSKLRWFRLLIPRGGFPGKSDSGEALG